MSRLFLSIASMLRRQLVAAPAEDMNHQQDSSCLALFPVGSVSIDGLPTEVLQMIFSNLPAVTYVFYAGPSFWPRKKCPPILRTPAHVCHRWRTIMNTVPFALRLVIGNVDAGTAAILPLMGNLECLLKERDRAPFDLKLETRGLWIPGVQSTALPAPLQLILRLLFERSLQWRSLTFDRIAYWDILRYILDEPLRLPRLEHIHLDFGDAVDPVKHVSSIHAFGAAPRLRTAHVAVYASGLLLDLPWDQLTHLTIKFNNMPHDVQLPPSLRRILRLSTQLTHLKLMPNFHDRSQQSSRIEYMIPSSVRHLTVGCATLLNILISPSVTTLQVTSLGPPRKPPVSMSLAPILNYIRRSRCDALSRLVIHGILSQDSGRHL
ncbi:hypothetical protein CPB85DRAFT_1305103, partial [Mucidula mucida]